MVGLGGSLLLRTVNNRTLTSFAISHENRDSRRGIGPFENARAVTISCDNAGMKPVHRLEVFTDAVHCREWNDETLASAIAARMASVPWLGTMR